MASFEERLERLTERHEALTQSVELWTASQRETADRHDRELAKLTETGQRHDREIAQLTALMNETGEFIHSLARIAEGHERRIEKLEEGKEK